MRICQSKGGYGKNNFNNYWSRNVHAFALLDGAIDTSNSSPLTKAFRSLLGLFAELERDLIVLRTSEGREAARKSGKRFGPPAKITNEMKKNILKDLSKMGVVEVARKYNISHTSVGRIRKEADHEG